MTTEPSLPFNQQVYTMTCANDDGAIRTAVHVSTTAQTSDIPDIIDTLYQRLAARGYHTWLYDHATNTRTDRQGLVDGTTIPNLRDLIDAVVRSEVHILNPALVGESVVETTRLDALLNYCRLIAGIVPEGQRLREVPLTTDDDLAAILNPTTTDAEFTRHINAILTGGDGPEDEAEWATPADVMDLLAGQPDVPPAEEA